jgi:hypothetical protein
LEVVTNRPVREADFSAGEFLPEGVIGVAAVCRRAVD